MCKKAVEKDPWWLYNVPNHFKTQTMCEGVVEDGPCSLKFVHDSFKTWIMCDQAVKEDSSSLQYVPGWFVTREGVYMWYDDHYDDDGDHWDYEDKFFEWYDGYKKRKAQKAKIKEELLPITWHLDRVMNWCMSEDEKKKRWTNCGSKHRLFCVW